jgi:hypothetical protein
MWAKRRCSSLTKDLIKRCTVQFSTGLSILRTLQDGVLIQNMFAQRNNNTWIVMTIQRNNFLGNRFCTVAQPDWPLVNVVRVAKGSSFGGHPPSLLLTIFPQLVGVIYQVLFNYLSAGGGGHLSSLILTIFPEVMGVICQVLFLLSLHRWWMHCKKT